MDDGLHNPEDIGSLLDGIQTSNDMVIGTRQDLKSEDSILRDGTNTFYNKLTTLIAGHKVKELTSGFSADYAQRFKEFLN
jgi:hypothetical protein